MQFIEKNSFNLRSAVYRLKKQGSELEFLLFPMIHIGSQEFYKEISQRLLACDLILAEGVKSRRVSILTLSYRLVSKIRRMDLITQHEGMQLHNLHEKIQNSDMEGFAFDERWSSMPIAFRLQLFLMVPAFVVYMFLFGSRKTIAEHMALDDLPSSDEILMQDDDFESFDSLLIDERDKKLVEHIAKLIDTNAANPQTVGILYGAQHMRNVVIFLMQRLKYRVVKAEWVKVFDL